MTNEFKMKKRMTFHLLKLRSVSELCQLSWYKSRYTVGNQPLPHDTCLPVRHRRSNWWLCWR